MLPNTVVIQDCQIFNNSYEGIVTCEDFSYDNDTLLKIENSEIHHNQIGLSLQYTRNIVVTKSMIHSNRSWGIVLRNSTIAHFGRNDIFRNECGGIKVMMNRFKYTVFFKNRIHHHTGPDVLQTRFLSENLEDMMASLDPSKNIEPIILLENLSYNNELQYRTFDDLALYQNNKTTCAFCQGGKVKKQCQKCLFAYYCNDECLSNHLESHKHFCAYIRENKILRVILEKEEFTPANKTITYHRRKIPLQHNYYGKEVLVKVSAGIDYYGLDYKIPGLEG